MTNKEDHDCHYCEATHNRLTLAQALESGAYQQIPHSERASEFLRDTQDRYSITGVATAELTNALWIRVHDTWVVYPSEILTATFPKMRAITENEYPDPGDELADQLTERLGPGDALDCPEQTACALGIHEADNSTHPQTIEVNINLLSPHERRTAGIPQDRNRPYPLNLLDFSEAANLIRRFNHLLTGHCTMEAEDEPPTN